MRAMIFAAGLGTRLRPLTDTRPKALVEVGGRPLLDIVAGRLVQAGVSSLVVNVHHFAEMVKAHLQASDYHVPVAVSDESRQLLDTGGGVLAARPLLEGDGRFLIHNVDILSNLDIRAFGEAARPDALATLVVSRRETSRYLLFDDDMRLAGWTNVRTGEVRSPFPDLDPAACRRLAFAGIHLLSDRIFELMSGRYVPGEAFPIMDFYLSVAAEHPIYGYVPEDLRLLDVGRPETLEEAAAFISNI